MFKDYNASQVANTNAQETEALNKLIAEWPDISSQANFNLIVQYHREVLVPITLQSLKETVGYLASEGRLSIKSEAQVEADTKKNMERAEEARKQEKGFLIRELTGKLKNSNSPEALVQLTKKFQLQNNEELRAKLDEINNKLAMQHLPVTKLKEIAKSGNAQVEQLPEKYDREALLQLTRTDLKLFARLSARYGAQVNERLGVKPRAEVGITVGGRR